MIMNLLKNNYIVVEISISDLNQYISIEKYKILTYDLDYQRGCGKFYRLNVIKEKK